MKVNIQSAIDELHRAFELLNEHLFESSLREPAILIQNQGRRKGILGWCSVNPIWQSEDESIQKHEINICAEHLARPVLEIAETMLHECVHLHNQQNGVKDCSRGGSYHNKEYKAAAETHGLDVAKHPKYGWAMTSLKPETADLINTFNLSQEAFQISRQSESSSAAQKVVKMKCQCGTTIRCSKEVNATCDDCGEKFKIVE